MYSILVAAFPLLYTAAPARGCWPFVTIMIPDDLQDLVYEIGHALVSA